MRRSGIRIGAVGIAAVVLAILASETPRAESEEKPDGLARYAVPFALPPGVPPLLPEVGLVYEASSKAGPYGWGWTLSGPGVIERSTRSGAPDYDDLGACKKRDAVELDGELLDADPAECSRFRSSREGVARVEYDGASDAWTVTRTDGSRWRYGSSDEGAAPTRSRLRGPAGATFRWALDQVLDAAGHALRIDYERPTLQIGAAEAAVQLYPRRFTWTSGETSGDRKALLLLDWQERRNDAKDPADRPVSYRSGFRIETALRLKAARSGVDADGDGELSPGGGDMITAAYDLVYQPKSRPLRGTAYIEPVSKLIELRRLASGEAAASSIRFGYAEPPRRFSDVQQWVYGKSAGAFFTRFDGDDALPGDLGCEKEPPGAACYACVFDFETCQDSVRSGCCSVEQNALYRSSTSLIDMNGDGWLDRVRISRYGYEWEVCAALPGKPGDVECAPWLWAGSTKALDGMDYSTDQAGPLTNESVRDRFDNSDPRASKSRSYSVVHADLVDMDGDGRPDRIEDHYYCDPAEKCPYAASEPNGPYLYWSFWRNTGSGFEAKRPWRAPLYRTRFEQPFLRSIALYEVDDSVRKMKTRSWLLDVSGDGRPDHLITDPSGATTLSLNLGSKFAGEQPLALDRPAARATLDATRGENEFDRGFDREFLDVNGDGLPDQIVAGGSLGSAGPPEGTVEIRFNTGTGYQHGAGTGLLAVDPQRQRPRQLGGRIPEIRRFRSGETREGVFTRDVFGVSRALADFNGDGVLDVLETSEAAVPAQKPTDGMLQVYYGLGDGSFLTEPERWPMPVFRKLNALKELLDSGIAVDDLRDVNGDGFPDRIALDPETRYQDLLVYLHPGSRLRLTRVTDHVR